MGVPTDAGAWLATVFGFSDHAEYDAKLLMREHELRRGDKYFSRLELLHERLSGLQEVADAAQSSLAEDLQSLEDAGGVEFIIMAMVLSPPCILLHAMRVCMCFGKCLWSQPPSLSLSLFA